jgi:hypothetical protein
VGEDTSKIVIRDVPPYDGEYELDVVNRRFNGREWNWIKQISGYMRNTINVGLAGGDYDLELAMAVIAMCRAGKIDRNEGVRIAEVLAEAPADGHHIELVVPEEDDAPLELTGEPESQSQNGTPEKPNSSGLSSSRNSESQDKTPSSTGTSVSDTSAPASPLTTSAS